MLKARRLIFVNATRGMRITHVNGTVPLPLDTEAIRRALNSPDPAIALAEFSPEQPSESLNFQGLRCMA